MFTRSELEIKTIPELRDLCRRYGIKPTGSAAYKVSYMTSLMAFPQLALQQVREGRGLKSPGFSVIQFFEGVIDEINSPTDEQAALIKITLEGRRMAYPDRFDQENLLNLHKAKMHLEMAVGLLNQSLSTRSPTSLRSRGFVAFNCSSLEYKVFSPPPSV